MNNRYPFVLFMFMALTSCDVIDSKRLDLNKVEVKINSATISGCENGFCKNLEVNFQVKNPLRGPICFDRGYNARAILHYLPLLNPDKMDVNYNLMNYPTDVVMPLQPDNLVAYIDYVKAHEPIILEKNSTAHFHIYLQNFFKNEFALTKKDFDSFAHLNFFVFDCNNSKDNYLWQNIEAKLTFK